MRRRRGEHGDRVGACGVPGEGGGAPKVASSSFETKVIGFRVQGSGFRVELRCRHCKSVLKTRVKSSSDPDPCSFFPASQALDFELLCTSALQVLKAHAAMALNPNP